MTEPAEEFYSRNAERYDKEHPPETWSEDFRATIEKFCDIAGNCVLDAGCGPGIMAEFFEHKGLNTLGVDIAKGMIEYAKENKEGEFKEADISSYTPQKKFDGIWCGSTIFFLSKDEMKNTLENFQDNLRSEGVLYVDFKEGSGKSVKQKWGCSVEEYRVDEREARKMLQDAGFKIIQFREWENQRSANYLKFLCKKDS